ncbi:MAG: tetratricopeptide repeat protein [Holophagales bacterium]|jgi:tetratricopeptide (TPR) repeat protein|nr:tetratricopeptide repeat protein [Holophagales bacterium]
MLRRNWLRVLEPKIFELRGKAASGSREDILPLATELNLRSRHEEALELLEPWLEKHRNDGEAWFERIIVEGDGGINAENLEEIHKEIESIRDENLDDAAHHRNLGYIRILQQRLDDAERALQQALERNGSDHRALGLMGLLCLRKEQPEAAKGWLLKALSFAPRTPRTLRLLAIACEEIGDTALAESSLVAALEENDCYFWGWHSLGELVIKQGDFDLGMRCINRARSLKSSEPASYFILSEIAAELGHLEFAQAEMHRLVLMSPKKEIQALAFSSIGELKLDSGDSEGAISYFTLAAETDLEAPNPWMALGDIAMEDGQLEKALRCYVEALQRDPDAPDVKIQIGYVLVEDNNPEEAEKYFRQALELDPNEFSAYLGLSECFRLARRTAEQVAMVKQAMDIAPDDADVWNAQGVAFEVEGHLKEATNAYEKALQLSPYHRKAANNLGFVLEKRIAGGEPDLLPRAIEAWKQRLLICRDECQSLKMATEHLAKLGVKDSDIQHWLETGSVGLAEY